MDWRPVCVHIAWTQTGRHSILNCKVHLQTIICQLKIVNKTGMEQRKVSVRVAKVSYSFCNSHDPIFITCVVWWCTYIACTILSRSNCSPWSSLSRSCACRETASILAMWSSRWKTINKNYHKYKFYKRRNRNESGIRKWYGTHKDCSMLRVSKAQYNHINVNITCD